MSEDTVKQSKERRVNQMRCPCGAADGDGCPTPLRCWYAERWEPLEDHGWYAAYRRRVEEADEPMPEMIEAGRDVLLTWLCTQSGISSTLDRQKAVAAIYRAMRAARRG